MSESESKQTDIGKVRLDNVRLSFPVLFEPKPPQDNPNGPRTFSAAFIFERGSATEKVVNDAMIAVAKAKWNDKAKEIWAALKASDRLALHDGDAKPDTQGYAGKLYLNARNALRPLVVAQNRTPLTAADGKPYAGSYVNASVQIWAQDNKYGKRINASLMGVQFLRDGERLSGGAVASVDDFEALPTEDGAASAEDMFN